MDQASNCVIYMMENDGTATSAQRLVRCGALYSGLPEGQLRRVQASGGKPQLLGGPPLHFSVSHSGGYWACAFGPGELGLDLQQHRPSRCEALARRFFHPDEVAWLAARGFAEGDFFRLWSAKESYVKLTGLGLGQGFETFSVLPPAAPGVQWRRVPFLPEYELCLCAPCIGTVELRPLPPRPAAPSTNHKEEL